LPAADCTQEPFRERAELTAVENRIGRPLGAVPQGLAASVACDAATSLPQDYSIVVESETILVAPAAVRSTGPTAISPDIAVARQPQPSAGSVSSRLESTAAMLEVVEEIEHFTQYSLVVRRSPENQVVAAAEVLSPTNKGVHGWLDKEKYLKKRDTYLAAGVNLLEIDALVEGDRVLPARLEKLGVFERNAWTVLQRASNRRYRGLGWNSDDPLPVVAWPIEENLVVPLALGLAVQQACQFNPWERLAASLS
jgi:hypothetical protein